MGDSRARSVLGHLHRWLGSPATSVDDGRLLERFVHQRDEQAFAELVARHGALVFGLCRRLLGNVQDAEDVFQATFLVLARKAASIRKTESLSSWLHGVAYRLALKARAEIERRRLHEQQAIPPAESAETDWSWREVRGLLDEELQRLPEKQRVPLVLCYLEGLTQDEAARRLGWPRGTLKRRLEAGRERLRIRLTRRGVTLGAGLFAAALTESAAKGAVSTALRSATVRAAMQFAAHETAALAATPAALLANGALQAMVTTKLKLGAMLILLLGCAVTAAGLAIPQAPAEKQPKNKAEAPAPARPAQNEQVRNDRYGDPLPPGAIARLGTVRLRHGRPVHSVVFSRDGKTAIAGDSFGFIIYWDVATGREIRRLYEMLRLADALAITRDGKTLACGGIVLKTNKACVCLFDVEAGKLLSRHELEETGQINQLFFTPDDKTLIVRDSGNIIRLWDVASKKVRHELKGHAGQLADIALSPDGKTLASASWQDPHVRLWDIASGKEKLRVKTHDTDVIHLAYSPDGKTIVSHGNHSCFVFFDANTGKILRKVEDDDNDKDDFLGALQSIQYAPDGKTLFCTHYSGVRVRDAAVSSGVRVRDAVSGKELRRLVAPPRSMNRLTFSPDGKILATFGGSPAFDLWDVANGKLLHPAPGHSQFLTSLVFSADGRQVFSAACDFPVQAWNAQTGERLYELGDRPNSPRKLALSPDGKLLAAGPYHEGFDGHAIGLWDLASRKEALRCIGHKYDAHSSHINQMPIGWSADGKTLVSSDFNDQTIRLWDAATGKQRRAINAKQDLLTSVVLSPDGKIVAAGGFKNGAIHLWSADTGKELRSIATPQRLVATLAFSPDGSFLASGGFWGTIILWEPVTGRLLRQWDTKTNWTSELAFARDGRTLVSGHGDDGSIRLWEVATGKERACFRGHRLAVRAVAISRDGRCLASGGGDTTILTWDATGGARPDAALSAEQLRNLWDDLNASDAGRASRALCQLALSPKYALPFLAEKLRPVAPLDAARQKQVDRRLADLNSEQFAVRQQAEAELEKMGPLVEPALRKKLESKPSLEMRQRIEALLSKWASERLQIARALEAIEHMNTIKARQLLEKLADGANQAWLTEEARAICKRLAE